MKLVKLVIPSRTVQRSTVNAKRFFGSVPYRFLDSVKGNARLVPLCLPPWFIFSESYAAAPCTILIT
jgi:hypothetical protein